MDSRKLIDPENKSSSKRRSKEEPLISMAMAESFQRTLKSISSPTVSFFIAVKNEDILKCLDSSN